MNQKQELWCKKLHHKILSPAQANKKTGNTGAKRMSLAILCPDLCKRPAPCYLLRRHVRASDLYRRQKERLDELRPLSRKALANLEHFYDIELTRECDP